MNLKPEEQILIKDIFAVSVNKGDSSLLYLPQFSKDVAQFGQNASLVEHSTYFDSLLMERLQVPQTDILSYLEESWNRAEDARAKPWNTGQEQQAFIDYSIEIIKNFINLSLQESEIFPEQMQIEPNIGQAHSKSNQIARKLMTHFEKKGMSSLILDLVTEANEEDFRDEFLEILLTRQKLATIVDGKAMFYLSTLVDLIKNPEYKRRFINLKKNRFMIDGPKGGSNIDIFSSFGLFTRLSILGYKVNRPINQQAIAHDRFEERMIDQLGNERLTRDRVRMIGSLQSEYSGKLLQAYKELMRKESQKIFLEWNYKLLLSNMERTKLAHQLYHQNSNELSHDGILINCYSCLLGLCKVITNMQDDKWKNIDPNYFMYHEKASFLKGDVICSKPGPKISGKKQFGTITEFFFLALQFLHVGVCGAMNNFMDLQEVRKRLERQVENFQKLHSSHPMRKQYQSELAKVVSKINRYWIVLTDEGMIIQTIHLLQLLLQLLPKWMGVNYQNLRRASLQDKPNDLIHFLPELLITLVSKYHMTMVRFKQNYIMMMREEHIRQILELTCLLLSQQELITNPYLSAEFVEMLFMFLWDQKAKVVHQQLRSSQVVTKNLTFGLVRFYCGIANTGRSNQFYEKFKYRQCANKIFTTLWRYEVFREDLKLYFKDRLFEQFINNMLTDTNFVFDQTNQYYEKYRSILDKKAEGPLSAEELKNEEEFEQHMGPNLQMWKSNLKLMRQLSSWSPQIFLTEADIKTAVPLLNNALRTFIDAGSFSSNRSLMMKFKIETGRALSSLVQIYANLDINELLSNEIVKDGRNYKKEYFSKVLQRASNEHYTGIDVLQKFQNLISKLSAAENEQEKQQIYGQIPDNYLCAFTYTLMEEPVKLPGGQVVDWVNIKRHLLNDQRDPFTRSPLKESDLIPDKQLKLEIQKWKKNRLEELKKGDKELKYGKIAVNQKGTEVGGFGMNPVVEEQELPVKYMCALTYTEMEDPVRLPGGQVVDLTNLKRHLVNDPLDPFTRKPLKESEIVPDKQLKIEIQKWRKNRKNGEKKETGVGGFGRNPLLEEE